MKTKSPFVHFKDGCILINEVIAAVAIKENPGTYAEKTYYKLYLSNGCDIDCSVYEINDKIRRYFTSNKYINVDNGLYLKKNNVYAVTKYSNNAGVIILKNGKHIYITETLLEKVINAIKKEAHQ